jgi:hypothetical protein
MNIGVSRALTSQIIFGTLINVKVKKISMHKFSANKIELRKLSFDEAGATLSREACLADDSFFR